MREVDILYIHPSRFIKKAGLCLIPLGVIPVLNFLRKNGAKVLGLNYPMELLLDKKFRLEDFISEINCSLLIMDLHWHQHSFFVKEISKIIKRKKPEQKIVVGGNTASVFANEVLDKINEIDFIIRGDGEIPLLKLWHALKLKNIEFKDIPNLFYRENGEIKNSQINFSLDSLDDLNFTDISFLKNWKHYLKLHLNGWIRKKDLPYFVLCIGSGCEYNCISCGGSNFSHINIVKRCLLKRSVDKVVEDIEYLSTLGVKKIHFSHCLQMFGREYWENLFYLIRKKNIKIGAFTEIWQLPDKDFIDEFSNTFIREFSTIAISPMTGSEHIRERFGKLYKSEEIIECIEMLEEKNIYLEIYFSYYLPYEKYSDFFKTIGLINRITNIYPADLLTIYCYPVSLDPGSILWRVPEKYSVKLIKKKFDDFYNLSDKLEFLSRIDKKIVGYSLSGTNLLLLYILWVCYNIKILFNKIFYRIRKWI